jgi:hypothetical protein
LKLQITAGEKVFEVGGLPKCAILLGVSDVAQSRCHPAFSIAALKTDPLSKCCALLLEKVERQEDVTLTYPFFNQLSIC